MTRRRALVGACFALLAACGRSPDKPATPVAATRAAPATSVVRLARAGGRARAYELPTLGATAWQSESALPAIDSLAGVDFEQHLIFAVDRKRNVFALDLDSRRTRIYQAQTLQAFLGPDASLYAVDTGLAVSQISRRAVTRFPSRLKAAPLRLFATAGGDVLAIESGRLAVVGADATRSMALPRGPVTATFWGDLIAIGTDSGIVLADPHGKRASATVKSGPTRALLFSPSGHRLYAVGDAHEMMIIDRFGRSILRRIALPGPGAALRTDFFGSWLLVRSAQGDSSWVVDLEKERVVGTVATAWAADLPAIATPHTVIARRGTDVVALDLASPALAETGRAQGGAADLWVPVVWAPAPAETPPPAEATADTARVAVPREAVAARSDSGAVPHDDTTAAASHAPPPIGAALYLQVSSSRNPTWASDLAAKLRSAGLSPSVLKPAEAEESYRVVLGPYRTRDEAEEAGRKLGMPSFVITAQGDSGR